MHLRSVGKAGLSLVGVAVLATSAVACSTSAASSPGQQSTASAPVAMATTNPTLWPSVIDMPTQMADKPTYEQTLPLFAYKGDQPFNVKEQNPADNQDGATVKDITFVGAAGEPIEAYLVLPSGNGPFPAILFEHMMGSTREEFLPEATTLAQKQHLASLLVTRPTSAVAGDDLTETVLQVREIRRALDFLVSQSQVDVARLAYVGHSMGAMLGVVSTSVDSRFKTAVFMTPVPSGANLSLFAPHSAASSSLFQFGNQDSLYAKDEANTFAALLPGTKQISWYDAGHGLNGAAQTDREAWLLARLAK
ncbi:MAG TPA: dienelactone hydrolase family protein [Candidatus Limnocylindrales bacterium]